MSCSNGGRLCECGHIKAMHNEYDLCQVDGCSCFFRDRAQETAPTEKRIPEDQNLRGIAAKRIYV